MTLTAHAQWAAEALADILAGKPNPQYVDLKKAEYWQNRFQASS